MTYQPSPTPTLSPAPAPDYEFPLQFYAQLTDPVPKL